MAVTTIQITHDTEAEATIEAELLKDTSAPREAAAALSRFFDAVASGARNASIEMGVDASQAYATGTLTCATVVADNTFAINGVTVTMKASGATGAQVNIGASNTLTAAAIATFINAYASFSGIVTATSSGAVVTVKAAQRGLLGNAVTLAGTSTTLEASGARLSGGTGRASVGTSYSRGV